MYDDWTQPLIPGFNPDPSVVHADGAYYLVTSSFECLPGLPLYRSTDLATWTHIGVATRPEQVEVGGVPTFRPNISPKRTPPLRLLSAAHAAAPPWSPSSSWEMQRAFRRARPEQACHRQDPMGQGSPWMTHSSRSLSSRSTLCSQRRAGGADAPGGPWHCDDWPDQHQGRRTG